MNTRLNARLNRRRSARWGASPQWRLRLALILLPVMTVVALCTRGDAQTSVEARHLKVSLVADQASVSPDAAHTAVPPHVGLLFDLEPGWHVYWTNAGDSGEPLQLPAGGRHEETREVRLQPGNDDLRLGIPEPGVELEQLGTLFGQHQARIEDPREAASLRVEAP